MTRQRKTGKRASGQTRPTNLEKKEVSKPDEPLFSVVYLDIDGSVKRSIQKIRCYQEVISYKDNFEDEVASIIEDGGVWMDDSFVIPIHRVLRFDTIKPRTSLKEPILKENSNNNNVKPIVKNVNAKDTKNTKE